MTELLTALAAATAATGEEVEVVFDAFPALGEEWAYATVPHEFRAWGAEAGQPDAQQRKRTIALCTENPGTPWFEETCQLVPHLAAAVSINRSSAMELRRRGIPCEHLQLGYCSQWDSWHGDENATRDIDVLYLGAADPRRDPLLAGLGLGLWARECQFLIPPLEPRTGPRADFLTGADKYARLRSARILLNLHRTASAALEWMRFLEAIGNGCVVVSEPCLDGEPLIAGRHFQTSPVEHMAAVVEQMLDDPERLRAMQREAYEFVRTQLPMDPAGRRLAQLAGELTGRSPAVAPGSPAHMPALEEASGPPTEPVASSIPPPSHTRLSRRALAGAARRPRAAWSGGTRRLQARRDGLRTLARSASYERARPRVSVLLTCDGVSESDIVETLASLRSQNLAIEALVLCNAADERLTAALQGLLRELPELPAELVRQHLDGGLARSRNILLERARGKYVFNLDACGRIFPTTLQRLDRALAADPHAAFAYPMVAVLEGHHPVRLLGSLPWEPRRITGGNWIDAMALIHRGRVRALGGYATDPTLAGHEDWDLWRRFAAAGDHGVHVPQVLAWRQSGALTAAAHPSGEGQRGEGEAE